MALQPSVLTNMGPRGARTDPLVATKIVEMLVRCHSARRSMKKPGTTERALSPSSRAVAAEAQALSPEELDWLRGSKEKIGVQEWARLKKRAKAAAQAAMRQREPVPLLKGPAPMSKAASPRTASQMTAAAEIFDAAATRDHMAPVRSQQGHPAEVVRLRQDAADKEQQLAAMTVQLREAEAAAAAAKAKASAASASAARVTNPAVLLKPAAAVYAAASTSLPSDVGGRLCSAPCVEILEKVQAEAAAVKTGVQECLEKELSSGALPLPAGSNSAIELYQQPLHQWRY